MPLYEAKMIWQHDHRLGSFAGFNSRPESSHLPQATSAEYANADYVPQSWYWIKDSEVESRLSKFSLSTPHTLIRDWLIVYRFSTSPTNERTMVLSVIPRAGANDILPCIFLAQPIQLQACFAGNANSFVYDYLLRNKMGRQGLNPFFLKQTPFAEPGSYDAQWLSFIVPRILELTYTAWDLEPFTRDLGYDGPPFRWNPERRFLLRCELDAAFFHLYGIGRDDADYIMETFPIVKRKDETAHGEYRTKRVILEIYDQMARAAETGQPYRTPLDPPPVSLDLDIPAGEPATVTPLRPRTAPEPSPPQEIAAEDRGDYTANPQQEAQDTDQTRPEPPEDTTPNNTDLSQPPAQTPG